MRGEKAQATHSAVSAKSKQTLCLLLADRRRGEIHVVGVGVRVVREGVCVFRPAARVNIGYVVACSSGGERQFKSRLVVLRCGGGGSSTESRSAHLHLHLCARPRLPQPCLGAKRSACVTTRSDLRSVCA